MDFHLHCHVRQRNGLDAGELRHVVCDPETREVISLVVYEGGLDGRAVILPIGAVDSADDDAVYTELTGDQFDRLERYAYALNVAPPPADLDPDTVSSDQLQEPIDVPDVPPVGAATGITSIAFTPILEIWRNVPAGSVILDDMTIVEASDGELGRVRHVLADDETRRVTGLVVEKGFIFTRDVEIPMDWVTNFGTERVALSVSKAEVEAASQE